jgi:hypothetical protein
MTEPSPSLDGEAAAVKPDPFDPESLRTGALGDVEVEPVLMTVPVRSPKRNEFFRVHPDPNYTVDAVLLERDNGIDKESFIVTPELQNLVQSELRQSRLFTAITKRGTVFLWPVKLPRDGHDNTQRIADANLGIAEEAKSLWVKREWDRELGAHKMSRAKGELGDPQWPDKSFRDLIAIAYRNNLIDRADHPVIRELAGEI